MFKHRVLHYHSGNAPETMVMDHLHLRAAETGAILHTIQALKGS